MRAFAEAFPNEEIVQQLVAHLPWGDNVKLIEMLKDSEERLWYARQAVEHRWSRNILVHQIEGGLHRRQGNTPCQQIPNCPCSRSPMLAA
ncbi:DUF1016 N-terminal domain-containing protein [Pseudorhizobium endolithicum]|uniref:DUF1016 N-terminal domain-containing protein n=1 Tax=Pseudorhizobium endolithicum TaxID=1191678 RepID=UPI0022A8984D|nr:DUF1016 N-terminal domain-containing protein [Pseudorhizobium endolithicum]